MRKRWKRWLAGVMTAVMLIAALPTAAYAAVGDLLGMSAVQRTALLEALEEVYGDDAEAYLAILEQYGLIDEDGNLVTDEKIVMDGVEYTLDEIEAILDDPATDLSKVVEVDGTFLTLEELKTIVEIERYLAYLEATYFTKQDLTDEQISSFYDLAQAWANGGVQMLAANGLDGVGPAGVDHGVRLNVSAADTAEENGTYTVTVTPNKPQEKDITFSWRALSGSVEVTGGGEVTIPADSKEPVRIDIQVGGARGRVDGEGTFLVQLYDLENALFTEKGSTVWNKTVKVTGLTEEFRYTASDTFHMEKEGAYYSVGTNMSGQGNPNIASYDDSSVPWESTTVSFDGLEEGRYQVTASIGKLELLRHQKMGSWVLFMSSFVQKQQFAFGGYYELQVNGDGNNGFRQCVEEPFTEESGFQFFENDPNNGTNSIYLKRCVETSDDWIDYPLIFEDPGEAKAYGEASDIEKCTVSIGFSRAKFKYSNSQNANTFITNDFIPDLKLDGTVEAQETTSDTTISFSVPKGTYYAGQNVPITAEFAFPVEITSGMTITVNGGEPLTPVETGTTGQVCTFLYPVDETSGGSISITDISFTGTESAGKVTGANDRDMTVQVDESSPIQVGTEASGVSLESIDRADAFASYNVGVSVDAETKQPQLVVTASLSSNPQVTAWVLNELEGTTLNALQVMTSQTGAERFSFMVDSADNPTALTATIPLPYNTSESDLTGQVDFLLDGGVLMGKGLEYTVSGSILVAADDMKPVLTVTPAGGEAAEYKPGEEVPLLYAQQDNALALSFTLTDKEYTWGNTGNVTYYDENNSLVDGNAHFAWKSSAPEVAAVTVQGGKAVVTPTGQEGQVTFTLVALNGAMADAESGGITVKFAVGQDPFLMIPDSGKTVSIREGQDAVVNWTSNLCAKNETAGVGGAFAATEFKVSLYSGESTSGQGPAGEAVWSTTLTTDENNKTISSVTVPWAELEKIYKDGGRSATVTVTARYNGVDYGTYYDVDLPAWIENATATISMISQPASVTLDEPTGGLYQTDGGSGKSVILTWTVPHLDTVTGGQFELYIAGGGLDTPISLTTVDEGGVSHDEATGTYSYTLEVPAVKLDSDPTSYRDSYAITVKAKNAAESTWAYDSYVLYVYSDSALRLLLDGNNAGGSHTMSNVDKIAGLWGQGGESGSEAIVALQRDIALKNVISINYGEYAWAELADQIQWASSNSKAATVNYQQGTLYENIENFSYTSYRPSTDFILSGLEDGETIITATHVKTGIEDTVTVNVETLRDKLYLFQCYPKTETTLTYQVYTSAAKTATEEYVLKTNDKGEAAIYAPYGIAGDVYCKSEVTDENDETVTYLGTIYNKSLVSSEADSTKLQLYPVNTLQLRRAAQAEIFLKKPDGTPYEGQVTFRGGVYRNGEYCLLDNVKFGLQDKDRKDWKIGSDKQTVETNEKGRLLVTMDLMQFKTSADQKDVQAGEKLYYLFQLDYGDGESAECYPIMLRVDASLNLEDIAASGDSIVVWEKNENKDTSGQPIKTPYVAQQTLKYSQSNNANVGDVRKSTGNVGPSTTFPNAWLTTTVMWWGDEHAGDQGRANTVMIRDTTGKTPDCQTSKVTSYPFTDLVFTENVMTLNNDTLGKWGIGQGEKRNVQAVLSEDGTTASRTLSLPFKLVNMIGVVQAEDDSVLTDALGDIESNLDVDVGGDVKEMGVGDKMLQGGMGLLAGDAKYDPEKNRDGFGVRLYATSDPTVFRALFCIGMGNMGSGGNVTGIYPEYTNTDDMAFVNVDGAVGNMDNGDTGVMPNLMNIYDMAKGNYLSNAKAEAQQAAAGKGVRSFNMDLGGYVEADIVYNNQTGAWECRPIGGGFHVGGGVNYGWNFNSLVGVVPVNISLTLGATVEIRLDITTGKYYTVDNGYTALENAKTEDEFNEALAKASYTERVANDYLATLRIFLYIRAFAGIGFDFSVVACKIGVFGQLNVDINFKRLNRTYLDRLYNISAVGPIDSRKEAALDGQEPRFSGSTGIEFVFKFLFISYEKVFCSIGFEIDGQYGDWDTIEEIWAANKTINGNAVTRMAMPNGQVMYAIDLGPQMESRDYVDAAEQQWVGGLPANALDLDENQGVAEDLQTGAYSYANPVLSDDGEVMFYLSDRGAGEYSDATDLTNTRVAVSTKKAGLFQEGSRFDNDNSVDTGYGDSNVKVAGSSGGYAAVWVRQMEDFTPASGDGILSEGQQMLQMNSTEIIAATSEDGSNWTLKRLTNNSTPDLAPVVATNGSRTVVAWREVSSTSADTLTSFDQQDAIRFAVYENGEWGATQTLYDGTGTAATVKGIEAAMLSDGTAAVVYTLDTNSSNDSNTDWETVVALIPADETSAYGTEDRNIQSEDTVRTFRLTTNSDLDENPQITTAQFDNTERFVVAWHTERTVAETGETESDIRLAAMDKDGVLYENMPESLGRATDGTGDTIGSNFRFAKNAEGIEDLSILWVDSVSGDTDDKEYSDLSAAVAAGYDNVGHDVLKAVKFVEDGSSFTVSGAVEVAEMAENTLIDHFDAYMSNGEIKSVILGTNYDETAERQVTISDGTTEETATIQVANPVTGMYTATAEFTNQIQESAVMLEYEKLYPNSDIDVQFTIRNIGKDAITALSIAPKEGNTTYYSTENDPLYNGETGTLNLLPNRDITVTAKFPTGAAIENVDYTIKATFGDSGTVELPGTLYLDIPDVGISQVETITPADGERTLRYSLYNDLSASLADTGDGWLVKVGFYADKDCTTPMKDSSGTNLVQTISEETDLALIDAGGYSSEVTIPVTEYVAEGEEIPDTGIPVYVKAWVEAPVNLEARAGEYDTVNEYYQGNNDFSVTLDNLAVRRNEDVTLSHTMSVDESGTTVNVTAQYNKLAGTASGNLIVTLLDAQGNPIAKQQSYTKNDGLLELSKEGTKTQTFTFTQKGASVLVEFSELILNESSVELDHVSLTGADVTYDPDTKTYTATGAGLTSGVLEITPKDPQNAKITFDGKPYDVTNGSTISLPYGTTEWTITVENEGNKETYKLVLNNTDTRPSSGGGGGSSSVSHAIDVPEDTEHGTVTVSPEKAKSGQTVTITVKPDEGYQVGKVTVTKSNGDTVKVTDKGNGVYTFTMPNSKVSVDVTFAPEGQWTNPFVDVAEDAWYYDAVQYVNENGLMAGTSANTFAPDLTTTRGMIVTILYRLEGAPDIEDEIWGYPFKDVDANAWYATAVYWARMNGIVAGYSDELFGPDDTITREQMAVILYRYAQYKGYDTTAKADLSKFTDAAQVGSWATEAIRWANAEGLVNGTSDTTLSPQGSATRSQAAMILTRFCQNIAN